MKYILSFFITLFFLTSCTEQPPQKIRIGFNTWVGYEAVTIAEQKDFFKKEGLTVEVQQFKSLYDVMQAFADRKIDVMFSTTNEVLLLADKREKLKIVLVADYSNGADAVVAQKSIQSINDLKGKTIGVDLGSVSHFLLLKALQKANIAVTDVKLVNVTDKDAVAQFANKSLDAITTWSPFTTDAVKAGGHIIFSSQEIRGQIVDVMSIRQSVINKYPKDCIKIIAAYFKTLDWLSHNKTEGVSMMAKAANMDPKEFTKALRGVEITRLDENLSAFGTQETKGTLYPATQEFIDFLLEQKVITHPLTADDIIDPNLIWEYMK